MIKPLLMGAVAAVVLTGCARVADSRFNPLNWFGRSQEAAVVDPETARPLVPEGRETLVVDNRALVQSIEALSVDRTASGAIVRATGIAPTQGYFNAQLLNRGVENGVLTLEMRAQAPIGFDATGSTRSRRITAAYALSSADLAGITTVRVQGATNARTTRR